MKFDVSKMSQSDIEDLLLAIWNKSIEDDKRTAANQCMTCHIEYGFRQRLIADINVLESKKRALERDNIRLRKELNH